MVSGSAPARKDDVNFKSSTIRFFGVDDDDDRAVVVVGPRRELPFARLEQ